MTTPMSLEVFGQHMRNQIERVGQSFTQPDDDWISILHIETGDRDHMIVGIDGEAFANDFTKDQLAYFLQETITETQAIHYGLLINTWTVVTDDLESGLAYRPSEHPERFETLVVMLADRHHDEMWTAKIIRHENAPPTLTEWEMFPTSGAYFGRFANLRECLRDTNEI